MIAQQRLKAYDNRMNFDRFVVVTPYEVVSCGRWASDAYRRVRMGNNGPDRRTRLGKLLARYEKRVCDVARKRWEAK